MKKIGWKNCQEVVKHPFTRAAKPDHNIHFLTAAVLIISLGPLPVADALPFSCTDPTFHEIMTGYHESWESS